MSKRLIVKNKLRGLYIYIYIYVFRYVFFSSFFFMLSFVEELDPVFRITNFNCYFHVPLTIAFTRELKSAEKQMRDLTLTVDLVLKDRAQFAHIDGTCV
jgi:hypothetical protein